MPPTSRGSGMESRAIFVNESDKPPIKIKIPTLFSLAVIGLILTISTIASIIKSKKDPTAHAHAGRVTGAKKREKAE